MINKTANNYLVNSSNLKINQQVLIQEANVVKNNEYSTLDNVSIPHCTYKANLGIKDISFGKKLETTLESLKNIRYGMNYLLDPNYKIKVVRGEENFKILNFYQKREDVIGKFETNQRVYGICNDLAAAYTSFLAKEHPEKIFVIVYDDTSMQYAVVHYYITAFDRTSKNIKIFESLNKSDKPIIVKELSKEKRDEFDKIFKDKNTIFIDPSTYQYGRPDQGEFPGYVQDKLLTLKMVDDKAKEMGRNLTFTYERPLMLGNLNDYLSKEERQNFKQLLSTNKKLKLPEYETVNDLAVLVSFDKNPESKVKLFISNYGDVKAYEADEIRDCIVKGSKFDILLNKFDGLE